jgi:hypothetical protein
MAGYRNVLMSVVIGLALVQAAAAQTALHFSGVLSATSKGCSPVCKVYSLADLGNDPKLCKWIADTIPEMIQPASWKQSDAKISFYAPSRILVINQKPEVHRQVDEFLQNIKKSVAQSKPQVAPGMLPAQFTVPDTVRATQPVQVGPGGYPIPMPAQTPKHLFHFIIRYEGEGIIDSNVVNFAKALKEMNAESKNDGGDLGNVFGAMFGQALKDASESQGQSQRQCIPQAVFQPVPPPPPPVTPPMAVPPQAPRGSNPPVMPPADATPSWPVLPPVPVAPIGNSDPMKSHR